MIDGRIGALWAFLVWLVGSGVLVHRLAGLVRATRHALKSVPAEARRVHEDRHLRRNAAASFRAGGLCALLWLFFDWLY